MTLYGYDPETKKFMLRRCSTEWTTGRTPLVDNKPVHGPDGEKVENMEEWAAHQAITMLCGDLVGHLFTLLRQSVLSSRSLFIHHIDGGHLAVWHRTDGVSNRVLVELSLALGDEETRPSHER